MQAADGVIVSSSLKRQGRRDQPIDPIRVGRFVEATHQSLDKKLNDEPATVHEAATLMQ
jgi:hypothetical protein